VKALIIGGQRHGEWIDTLDGTNAWVDIRTATTHRIRKLNWAPADPITNQPSAVYVIALAVHPDLTIGGEQQEQIVVTEVVKAYAFDYFFRAEGEKQDLPEQKIEVPDSPAGLTGPDGRPL
jgi:hypothetical protein